MPSNDKLDITFMNCAKQIAQLSNCVKHKVGAVLVDDNRIISMGYNGALPGAPNCSDVFDGFDQIVQRDEHRAWSEENEVHAEMNALAAAGKNGISTAGATCFCTLQPCFTCLKNLVAFGVTRIVYDKNHHRIDYSESMMKHLSKHNIKVEQLNMENK